MATDIKLMSTKHINNLLKKYNRLQGHVSTPTAFVEQLEAELILRKKQKEDNDKN